MIRTISDDLVLIHRFRGRMELELQRKRALRLLCALFAVLTVGVLTWILR